MARFSANITDSSEDEDDLYLNQRQEPPKKTERSRPVPVQDTEDSEEDSELASSSSSSSDMEEEELISSSRRKRPAQTRNSLIEDDNGEIQHAHEVTKRPQSKKSPPRRGDPTIIPWAQQLGVDPQKMHVMQTSLFRMPEEAAAMKAMSTRPATSAKRLQLPSLSVNRKHSRDSDGGGLRMDQREV